MRCTRLELVAATTILLAAFANPTLGTEQRSIPNIVEREEEAIRSSMSEVLQAEEFAHLRRMRDNAEKEENREDGESWLQKLLDRLFKSEDDRPISLPTQALRMVLYLLVGIMLTLAFTLIVRAMVQRQASSENSRPDESAGMDLGLQTSGPPGEIEASEYLARARVMAEQGEFAAAVRTLLLGSMSWIERAGLIRYRLGLTNRDYLRAVSRRPQRGSFSSLANEFERIVFGRRTANAERYKRCLLAFEEGFGADEEESLDKS